MNLGSHSGLPSHQPHYPLAPLMERAGASSQLQLARFLGVPVRTIQRWSVNGIRETTADRVATALGFHPSEIWPEWFPEEIAP